MKVVDASVVIKLLINEDGSDSVRRLIDEEDLIVPELVFLEVANTLATKMNISEKDARESLEFIYDLGLRVEPTSRNLLVETVKESKKYGTAVYDMLYAVVAKELNIQLITADRRFIEKTKFGWLKLFD